MAPSSHDTRRLLVLIRRRLIRLDWLDWLARLRSAKALRRALIEPLPSQQVAARISPSGLPSGAVDVERRFKETSLEIDDQTKPRPWLVH